MAGRIRASLAASGDGLLARRRKRTSMLRCRMSMVAEAGTSLWKRLS